MALTVVFSLFASLAVALFLIPMLASRESSKFIRGVQAESLFRQHIFQFSTEEKINSALASPNAAGFLQRIRIGLTALFLTGALILWKILQVFAGKFLMAFQIKIGAVVDALQLFPAKGK